MPKVGCLCISAGRSVLLPIALRSYEAQTYSNKMLLIEYGVPRDKLTEAIDNGCRSLFFDRGCTYVAIWDDDDYSPPDRLHRSVDALHEWHSPQMPALVSYQAGWFCNLETLRAERIDVAPNGHLWGGAMTFNEAAWVVMGYFGGKPVPGYDRVLQSAVRECGRGSLTVTLSVAADGGASLPVAFCHGRNMATFMGTPGVSTLDGAAPGMPQKVREAVDAARDYMLRHGLHVPAPEVMP